MAETKRTEIERERDLELIAGLYLRGFTQQAIAHKLNQDFYNDKPLSRQQIGYDIRVLIGRWQKSAERKINERKAEELARVDRLEREYWDAWERSQLDAETSVTERVEDKNTRFKALIRKAGQVGDPRFLAGVQWCIQKRCELLGLDAPKRQEHTGVDGGPIRFDLDAWKAERARRLAALEEGGEA